MDAKRRAREFVFSRLKTGPPFGSCASFLFVFHFLLLPMSWRCTRILINAKEESSINSNIISSSIMFSLFFYFLEQEKRIYREAVTRNYLLTNVPIFGVK